MKLKEFNKMLEIAPEDTELNFFLIPNDGSEEDGDYNDIALENLNIISSSQLDDEEPQIDLGVQLPKNINLEKLKELIFELGFDAQRMSGSGQATYRDICNIIKNL
jgi:hypothetical protein